MKFRDRANYSSHFYIILSDIEINIEVKNPTDEKTEVTQKVEEYLANIKRSQHVRPWDVGKAGVKIPGKTGFTFSTPSNAFYPL